jgi:outer membrane protein assembly factor BamB
VIYVNTGNGMDRTHVKVPFPSSPSFIALDRHTGKMLAQDDAKIGPRIFHAQWSSPSSGVVNGRQLVFFGAGDGWLYAFDAKPVDENGKGILKTVWKIDCNPPEYKQHKYPDSEGPSEIMATPVFFRNRVYVAVGQDPDHGEGVGRLLCIDATWSGDVTESGVIWDFRKIYRSISTVSIDPASSLLFVADFSGFLYCLDAITGQQYWRHDAEAHIWGSTLVADGKVFVGDEDGDFYTFAATREKRLLGRVELPAPIYTAPVVANGALFVQTPTHLFCVHQGSNARNAAQTAPLPSQPNSAAGLPAR